ncbi:MAG: 3-oxoacyl-[acyl-carrier-protein] reductase [Lachnospiraceae bacterium]
MMNGKVALVTGASRGIGKAVAFELASRGAMVALVATRENDATKELVESLNVITKARMYVCDIADSEQIKNTVDSVLKDFGTVDYLVNNAGITRDNLLMSMSEDEIDSVLDVNLKGTILMTKALIRTFIRKKSGSIVNISSVVGIMGNAGQVNYAASKAGIIGVTKSVAREYASRNIRCNAVAPGFIATDMTDSMTQQAKDAVVAQIPSGKLGTPQDVARVVAFLLSDDAGYITGEVIKVAGGMGM